MDHEPASVPTPTADRACEGPYLEALGVRLMHLRKAVGLTRWELPAGEGWVSSWRRGRLERARTLQEPSAARQLVLQSIGNRLVGRRGIAEGGPRPAGRRALPHQLQLPPLTKCRRGRKLAPSRCEATAAEVRHVHRRNS
jgi:hypothetical protein